MHQRGARRNTITLLVGALLLLAGCNDDNSQPFAILPDGSPPLGDAGVPFLTSCEHDTDCISGRCITLAGSRRCSRECNASSPCPSFPQWSCTSDLYCACNGEGKQPTTCKVDGDCDGQADKTPVDETCNGEDDDCNGVVDDVPAGSAGAEPYFEDVDRDGFGNDTVSRWLCTPQTGWTTAGGDCNDSREQDNPDAVELCGDTFDNDCDGDQEDVDVCGLTPIQWPDVNGSDPSAVLSACPATPGVNPSVDITEIVAKQDTTAIKFTVRLAGLPALTSCASYMLRLGDPQQTTEELVYIFRPSNIACGSLPAAEAYLNGQPLSTTMENGYNASQPGHVSFTLTKTEFFPHLSSPTYRLKACSNAEADALTDLTDCSADSCETLVHR